MKKVSSAVALVSPAALTDLALAAIDGGAPPLSRSNAVRDPNEPTVRDTRSYPEVRDTGPLPQGQRATFENGPTFHAPQPRNPASATPSWINMGK